LSRSAGAAIPQRVIDRGGGGVAVRSDQELDRVHRAGSDLDLLWGAVLDQVLAFDALDEHGIDLKHPVDAQDAGNDVVGEHRVM
jgi:hypothetical protein